MEKKSNLELPPIIFEDRPITERIITEQNKDKSEVTGWRITNVEYGEGIKLHIEGADYPQKGFANPEAVQAINILKKIFVEALKTVTTKEIIFPLSFLVLLPYKRKIKVLSKLIDSFNRIAYWTFSAFILRNQYMTEVAQELRVFTSFFLRSLGVPVVQMKDTNGLDTLKTKQTNIDYIAKVIAHFFEYDNAYRLRIMDLFASTTKEKLLEDPRKEIKNMVQLLGKREKFSDVTSKISKLAWLLSTALLHPNIKKAFRTAIFYCDYSKMIPDNTDKYWMCHREDYDFFGMTLKERHNLLEEQGLSIVGGKTYKL